MIYNQDWFLNRNELGKYKFDTSKAIYNFSSSSVSQILYGPKLKDLYKDPRTLERECEAINHLINPKKFVKVTIHKEGQESYTDGKDIVISGKALQDLKEKGIDIILGLTCHESSHIRFTDFSFCKKCAKNSATLKWIWNLLEDEVIEELLQIEKPGLGNLLSPIKDYMFDSDKPNFKDDIDLILYILFALIRYPKNLNYVGADKLVEFENLFNDIYNILKTNNVLNVYIKDTVSKETYNAACEILKLLNKYISENLQDQKSLEDIENELNSKFGEGGEISDLEGFGNIKKTILASSTAESENGIDVINKIKNLSKHPIEIDDYEPKTECFEKDFDRGSSPTLGLRIINRTPSPDSSIKYNRLKDSCKSFINTIKKINIRSKEKSQSLIKEEFQRNGSLDSRLLASAFQNEKNVYQRYGIKHIREKMQKFTLILTLDESGSMGSENTRNTVSKIAISFVEAFKDNPNIDLYVFGHSDYIVKYIDPSIKSFNMLAERYQGYGQNEVKAYHTILDEVTKKSKNNILLVNVTDSQYLANYSEIEQELNSWKRYKNLHIMQSLIVVNDYLTSGDIAINNKIYGQNKWINIKDINNIQETNCEIKKLIKHIQQIYSKLRK